MSVNDTVGTKFGSRYIALDSDNDSDVWQVQERNKRKMRSTWGSYEPGHGSGAGAGVGGSVQTETVYPVWPKLASLVQKT